MNGKTVLCVGHCAYDHGNLSQQLAAAFQAHTTPVASAAEALSQIRGGAFALALVNRLFDADGASGVEFIRTVKADPMLAQTPLMLVSNFDSAQQEAAAAGAAPGFGKDDLGRPAMLERLRPFLAS